MSYRSLLIKFAKPVVLLLAVTGAVVLTEQRVCAQEAGDVVAGHKLAQTWCSSCHVVDSTQKQSASTGAPPFAAIAAMSTTTFMGLRAFLQTPHNRMPDLHLSHDEIDDVAAYIISLKKKS